LLANIVTKMCRNATYSWSIGRLPILFVVMTDFVEIVFVQLADETSKVAVFEMLGKYVFCELLVLAVC
jgi:hypothetical protein